MSRGDTLPRIEVLREIVALPDHALVEESRAPGYFRIALPLPRYVSDPDFACYGTLAATAAVIRADLVGRGEYAPHFSPYDVEYRLLPHWRARAAAHRK